MMMSSMGRTPTVGFAGRGVWEPGRQTRSRRTVAAEERRSRALTNAAGIIKFLQQGGTFRTEPDSGRRLTKRTTFSSQAPTEEWQQLRPATRGKRWAGGLEACLRATEKLRE